jgi:hypothetical protein
MLLMLLLMQMQVQGYTPAGLLYDYGVITGLVARLVCCGLINRFALQSEDCNYLVDWVN